MRTIVHIYELPFSAVLTESQTMSQDPFTQALNDYPQDHAVAPKRRQLFAAMIGNVLEYYDFIIFAYMASLIARNFYQGDGATGLLASFATFGVGFLARPLGGAVIGRIADKYGRSLALKITIYGMALGTVGIGLLPTYDTAGIIAPILLVVIRLIQGLAAGGEWGTATTFVVESAPMGKRGFYGALGQAAIASAQLVTSLVVAVITLIFTEHQMVEWAWRIPFLLGAVLLPVGAYMRRNLEETPAFIAAQNNPAPPEKMPTRIAMQLMGKTFGFAIIWTVSYYVMLSWMPTFLNKQVGFTQTQALFSNAIALTIMVATIPFFGALSDRIGRKPLLLACCLAFVVLSYPLFLWVLTSKTLAVVLTVQIIFNLFIAAFSGAAPAALCEIFPTASRTMLLSIGYSLSTAIFGGFAPFISTGLIDLTGMAISPTFYLMLAGLASGLVIMRLRETAKASLQ
ncbi:MFS transporter [Candidatus Pantoea formicae]|uniref:MFS transporter n=1 Tax=Candidatus Pantoea formicae TaxID=2608355 RepID=UPI003ED9FC4B